MKRKRAVPWPVTTNRLNAFPTIAGSMPSHDWACIRFSEYYGSEKTGKIFRGLTDDLRQILIGVRKRIGMFLYVLPCASGRDRTNC